MFTQYASKLSFGHLENRVGKERENNLITQGENICEGNMYMSISWRFIICTPT